MLDTLIRGGVACEPDSYVVAKFVAGAASSSESFDGFEDMVHIERTIEPDPDRHEEYAFDVDRYIEANARTKEPMFRMTRHVAAKGAPLAAGAPASGGAS